MLSKAFPVFIRGPPEYRWIGVCGAEFDAAHRRPYIYTEEQVAKLLATARALPSPMSPLRPLTLYTMLMLAYCAGLRLREVYI